MDRSEESWNPDTINWLPRIGKIAGAVEGHSRVLSGDGSICIEQHSRGIAECDPRGNGLGGSCGCYADCRIPKLIQDGRTGRLIEPKDYAGLRAAIEFAVQEPQQMVSFAKEARRLIESDFAFDLRMKKIAAIYDKLLLVKP